MGCWVVVCCVVVGPGAGRAAVLGQVGGYCHEWWLLGFGVCRSLKRLVGRAWRRALGGWSVETAEHFRISLEGEELPMLCVAAMSRSALITRLV